MIANRNCNYYPNSYTTCVSTISIFKCQYNRQQKQCLESNQQDLGCSEYLNKEACINQLTNFQGENIFCAFYQICQEIQLDQVNKIGCSDKVNKFACMNVNNQKCSWNNSCGVVKENSDKNTGKCNYYKTPVTPYTCQQIPSALCMNNGYDGDFRCVEVRLDQLSKLTCNELGLNEKACISITTDNQFCVFQNNQCQSIQPDQVTTCNQKLNKNACISRINQNAPQLICEWIDSQCRVFQVKEFKCQTKNEVNVSVCISSQQFCMYDEKQKKCMSIDQNHLHSLGCNTPGLSKKACLKITSQSCSFFQGRCQELNEEDLSLYQCNMDLNQNACVNLKNNSQLCLWDGNNCQVIFVNQETQCPLELKNSQMKVNGNVCQAISKPNVKCKYDINHKLCIESSIDDQCSTPFLNFFGCVSILKSQQTCQWTNNGCKLIMIQYNLTSCESLVSVNPISCSQVYQDDSIGCYYDSTKNSCQYIQVNSENESVIEILKNINCQYLTLGLNKVMCGSITTKSMPCRWFQDKCVYFSRQNDIADVPCLHLQYSNSQACALATLNNEPCMYSKKLIGCIDTFQEENKDCKIEGLNFIGCDLINKNLNSNSYICQFVENECNKLILSPEDIAILTDPVENEINKQFNTVQKCSTRFLTKIECASIITQGQLCQWSYETNSCIEISVEYNTKCIKYSGKDIIINPNVCASIQTDQLEYCSYDKETTNCKISYEGCTTQCCTEIEKIGINANSFSKFTSSNTDTDVYCYFYKKQSKELKNDLLDTSNEELVKSYFNQLQLPCTSMNYKSCHMINWSRSECCYFNGQVCTNLKSSRINDLTILTNKKNKLLSVNEFACFSIEAKISVINKEKYFGYDVENKICKILQINEDYKECELAIGNKNVCTRFTGDKYCIWNSNELKCQEITVEELGELTTCNSNLNRLACIVNVSARKPLPCFFSYNKDLCSLVNYSDVVECEYFKGKGEISKSVCERIDVKGQKCEYSNEKKTCVKSEGRDNFPKCNIPENANNRVCYSRTDGMCRWDPLVFKCYENQTEIAELNCTNNLNKNLCILVQKQACMWDDVELICKRFNNTNSVLFEKKNQNVNHLYNERACLLITEAGYYYDKVTKKCIKIEETRNDFKCDQYQMNKYACLYLTRGNRCFFDQYEQPPKNLCKLFEDEQSVCNTSNLINIEVCMNIPAACNFQESTLECQQTKVQQNTTCTSLFNDSKTNKIHHNKISCASISADLTESSSEKQCTEEKDNFEKCLFEKYCYWKGYTCQVYRLLIDHVITESSKNQSIITCPDIINEEKGCQQDFSIYIQDQFIPSKQIIFNNEISWYNTTCINSTQLYARKYNYTQINDDSQKCQITLCSKSEKILCTNNIQDLKIIDKINALEAQLGDQQILYQIHHSIMIDDNTINKVCPNQFSYPNTNQCKRKMYYTSTTWCQLVQNEIRVCEKSFSKALCLELNQEMCFHDINQGGCLQLEKNKHNIPNCSSFSNNCFQSYSKNAICQNGVVLQQPGNSCFNVKRDQQICEKSSFSIENFRCNQISEHLTQPVLCASAQDFCWFDGVKCVNTMTDRECDKSFSKKLCIEKGCDYDTFGYCSKKDSLTNLDCSNKYYQCYEVTQLFTSVESKKKICGLANQACKFTDKCEDATHSTCQELSKLVVSKQACVRCTGLAMKYDNVSQLCEPIAQDISQCENLNKLACLLFQNTKQCQWQKSLSPKCSYYEFECKEIDIKISVEYDCQSLNQVACNQEQKNLCWFNMDSKLCEQFNPLKGNCGSYKNKQICNLSMIESCKWESDECKESPIQSNQDCGGLNKFGCLNLKSRACVWSKNEKCEEAKFLSEQQKSCTEFLQNQSDILHMNAQTCSQINSIQNCLLGKNYICREILEPELFKCEQPGLNNKACLLKTYDSCAFKDQKCISSQDSNIGCQDNLNEVACLNQDDTCRFEDKCLNLQALQIDQLNTLSPYSKKVCTTFFNSNSEDDGMIYSTLQKKCLQVKILITRPKQCDYPGVNKYACLYQIQNYCQYVGEKCQFINPSSIKECLSTLNSYACINVENVKCKFSKIKSNSQQCMPIDPQDDCESIKNDLVNKKVCESNADQPCQYNSKEYSCKPLSQKIKESCRDLNEKACIFQTDLIYCQFDDNAKICHYSLGYSNCTDKVNKTKCLAIITTGQYCKFNEDKGCQPLDKNNNLEKCETNIKTNPITCSQSTDFPCFYDKEEKQCKKNPNCSNQYYRISNIYSFNQKACQQFNCSTEIFLQWKEGACIQIKGIQQLVKLNCNQNLNQNMCVNIKKPFQYCRFYQNNCYQSVIKDYQKQKCKSIKLINSGAFCSQTQDVPCYYDSQNYECKEVPKDSEIECAENNPEQKGYNQKACEQNENCFFNQQCFKKTSLDSQNFNFCKDVTDLNDCSKVMQEGCMITDNQCVSILNSDYNQIKCEQAKNQKGCTNIQTERQFCLYDQGVCKQQNLIEMRDKNCVDIKFVNNQEFCQYPQDEGCIYDFTEKSCKEVEISEKDQLTCSKGMNRIACLQLTNQNLKCQFLDYCFGPNIIDKKCDKENQSCVNAKSIETCLNQVYCQCQWQNDQCQSYPTNSQQLQCDKIKNSSVAVCNSLEDCIFDPIEFICKITKKAKFCDQLQSPIQCSKMANLPCIWTKESCSQLKDFDQMNCQDIELLNGSQRACMSVKKQGQLCIFKDNSCKTFEQNKNQDNCLDNININSCLQQKISDCYWNIDEDKETKLKNGTCMKFDQNEFKSFDISNLSYTACLNIKKEGVFSKWNKQYCQIIDDKKFILYKPSDLKNVNQNACGLVNNGDIVKYDFTMKFCREVDDILSLSCLTEGLNKEACLNVKFQNCVWDSTNRKCRHQINLTNLHSDTCDKQNWSSSLCSQINQDQACGFLQNGCGYVDLDDVKCTHEGLNKYACLNVRKYTCIWLRNQNDENYHCEDYLPYLPCKDIPSNVNPKVCSMVKIGACYYNQQNFRCEILDKGNNDCKLSGLNIIGCVQIDNCFFDQQCQQLNKKVYYCKEFPIANKLICKNAQDSCKYDEFVYGCQPAQDESCSNDSLSVQGCLNQPHCILKEQKCQCRKFIEDYDCTSIEDMDKCKLKSLCIVQQQQCKQRICQDYYPHECEGQQILRSICYLRNTKKCQSDEECEDVQECQSAEKCEDIQEPQLDCSNYQFNNKPCQKNENSDKCELQNCENFNEETCLQQEKFCTFNDQKCENKKCHEYKREVCSKNKCEWNSDENACHEYIDCSSIQKKSQCNYYKYLSKPCQWNVDTQLCIEQRCSNIKQAHQCFGSRVGSQNCFLIDDSLCISCEEISDSCNCLQYSQYCSYDIIKDICSTKNCESYQSREECPSHYCTFINQKCQLKCEYLYYKEFCYQQKHCKWIDKDNQCQIACEQASNQEQCKQMNTCQWIDTQNQCQIECGKYCLCHQLKDEKQCQQKENCSWKSNTCQEKLNITGEIGQAIIAALIMLCLILT